LNCTGTCGECSEDGVCRKTDGVCTAGCDGNYIGELCVAMKGSQNAQLNDNQALNEIME